MSAFACEVHGQHKISYRFQKVFEPFYLANRHNSVTHFITVVIRLHFLIQNNHVVPSMELLCLHLAKCPNLNHYITVVIGLQNNHAVPSIELPCLYLAKCQNLNHYITVVIGLQNNHAVPSIELPCLYLAKCQNLNLYITVVIRLHFLMQNNHVVPSIELLCQKLQFDPGGDTPQHFGWGCAARFSKP